MNITREIWKKFHVHKGDNLPFEGWWNSTRDDLISLFGEVGYKVGAEIGVRSGRNSLVMFQKIPDLKLYCVDPWGAYLRVTDERQERYFEAAQQRLAGQNVIFMKKTSMDAVKEIPDASLDFVYIDGRHEYSYVLQDLIYWSPKVRKDGIISGHDYYHFFQGGVVQAVEAFTMANDIKQWFITREKEHSFFWVKE